MNQEDLEDLKEVTEEREEVLGEEIGL